MPRGENKNSKANLAKGKKFNAETARKANQKSQEVKKEYKTFKECFKDQITDEDRKEMCRMLVSRAKHGNLRAFEILRDTLGEKPISEITVESTTPKQEDIDAIEAFMLGDDSDE